MEEETKTEVSSSNKGGSSSKYLVIAAIIIILAIAGYAYAMQMKSKPVAMTPEKKTTSATTVMQPTVAPTMAMTMYKDGTYSAEGGYVTHIGPKHIKVTVTLKNNIITSADVVDEADDPMSVHFQDSFISGYKPLVIGKDITTVHLTKVALSSLTPTGFNNALQTIEKEAKS